MALRVLIVPDKFKGTLSARDVANAIAKGWRKSRAQDVLTLLPMTDGGDGFGEVMGALLHAKARSIHTVDAARRLVRARWWFDAESKTAIIEAAQVNGLALMHPGKFHPFQLDTFGLGRLFRAAIRAGTRRCIIGIGGSATNDGGFGLARSLGWNFLDARGQQLLEWWQLKNLSTIVRAEPLPIKVSVAVDVDNPLLGANGCSRIYGPQKGLRTEDFALAESCLKRLAAVSSMSTAAMPGAGAAGGLGFGLAEFLNAKIENGFELFARHAGLDKVLAQADFVITGEGRLDNQTAMGKGTGRIAQRCRNAGIPCCVFAGTCIDEAHSLFDYSRTLTDMTTPKKAISQTSRHLEILARDFAGAFKPSVAEARR